MPPQAAPGGDRRTVFTDVHGQYINRLAGILLAAGPAVYIGALVVTPGEVRPHGDAATAAITLLTLVLGGWLIARNRSLPKYTLDLVATTCSLLAGLAIWLTNGIGYRIDVHPIFAGIIVIAYLANSPTRAAVQHIVAIASFSLATIATQPSARVAAGVILIPAFWYTAMGIIVGIQRRQNMTLVDGLRRDAWIDKLTGIENRTAFLTRTNLAIEQLSNESRSAVLIVDLDDFKEINDSLGHGAGDHVLTEVGKRLDQLATESGASVTVARLGGDEFALLVTDATPDDASALARALILSLRRPLNVEGIELSIDASVGIALAPQHGTTVSDLLRSADIAMYAAKSSKTSIAWSLDPTSRDTPRSRLVLLGDLRRAIAESELKVYFQPKVRMTDRALHGVEALVRWPHPTYGFVSPAEFVAAAEQTGLIHELTDFVLDTSLRQCRAWFEAGLELRVAVNVSTRNLLDPGFADRVRSMLNAHKLRGEYLVLEITEGTLMQNPENGRRGIEKLKELGVEIALDDFGTGFSSLSYLNMLPIDELKIDRSFLTGVLEDGSTNRAIIRAAVQLGRDLKMRVVVEGVEHEPEAEALMALGCEIGQGYLFGRPMPADEITSLVGGGVRFGTRRPKENAVAGRS